MLLHVNPETSSVAKPFITLIALIWFIPGVNMFMLFQKFVIVETFATGVATILIVSSVFALVVT